MATVKSAMREVLGHIQNAIYELDEGKVEQMIKTILKAKKIFIHGTGRSGLVAKAFAMRLMHLGFNVWVIGEIVTPPVSRGDLYIAISGSGETHSVIDAAKISKATKAKVVAITSHPESTLGKIADLVVKVRGRTKLMEKPTSYIARQMLGKHTTLAPLGTVFEDTALLFLDGIISELMIILGKTEKELKARHTTFE
ncbi:MAG: 6-phospho-3-hexuloisomerase [Euryarchaeota archaeon]|nr:6-phospho-3-hexuloisomerase [Euryarchaeota archaeon]